VTRKNRWAIWEGLREVRQRWIAFENGCYYKRSVLQSQLSKQEASAAAVNGFQSGYQRYVPLLVWVAVIATLIVIPLKIVGYGFVPVTDAMRYAAKAFAGKSWSEILVLRPDAPVDHSVGWELIIQMVHRVTGASADGLVAFSVAGLFMAFVIVPLIWLRRAEAWLAALAAIVIAAPVNLSRVMSGRPYILEMVMVMSVLLIWSPSSRFQIGQKAKMILTTALMAAVVWIHGCWYLYALLLAAFLFAGQWKNGALFGGCWLAGSIVGAVLTGHPTSFLGDEIALALTAFSQHTVQRQLVTEFMAVPADALLWLCAAALLLWRAARGRWTATAVFNPAFMLAVLGAILGVQVYRFWLDWGVPALLVWMALQVQDLIETESAVDAIGRGTAVALLCAVFFISTTSDISGRWTNCLEVEYMMQDDPELAGWLPEKDGIIYSTNMDVFYETFFKNPRAPWRYVLGFEPTFMQADDLKTLRTIDFYHGAVQAYEQWVKKMRPEDRLVMRNATGRAPSIAGLEWKYAVKNTWIGRLPRKSATTPKLSE